MLRITPFSEDEKEKYQAFLGDRNLLVHHGGIYTFGYASQRFARRDVPELAHWSSLIVSAKDYKHWAVFLLDMARKIAAISKKALQDYAEDERIHMSDKQKRAIDFFA